MYSEAWDQGRKGLGRAALLSCSFLPARLSPPLGRSSPNGEDGLCGPRAAQGAGPPPPRPRPASLAAACAGGGCRGRAGAEELSAHAQRPAGWWGRGARVRLCGEATPPRHLRDFEVCARPGRGRAGEGVRATGVRCGVVAGSRERVRPRALAAGQVSESRCPSFPPAGSGRNRVCGSGGRKGGRRNGAPSCVPAHVGVFSRWG